MGKGDSWPLTNGRRDNTAFTKDLKEGGLQGSSPLLPSLSSVRFDEHRGLDKGKR